MNGQVFDLEVYNNELVAGGGFTTAGGISANRIARWNGASWQAMGAGMNSDVKALTVYNNDLIAGGVFSTAGGLSAGRIARWNGLNYLALGTGLNNAVETLAVYNDVLVAGGNFTNAGGLTSAYIARYGTTSLAPVLLTPEPQSVGAGSTLTLWALPQSGIDGNSYQWRRNGQPIISGRGGASAGGGFVTERRATSTRPSSRWSCRSRACSRRMPATTR